MAEDEAICCCGPKGWTRFIAWGNIISSPFIIALYTAVLISPKAAVWNEPPFLQYLSDKSWLLVLQLILNIAWLIFSVVLLVGSKKKNYKMIGVWLVFDPAAILGSFVLQLLAGTGTQAIIAIVVSACVHLFFICVVCKHMEDVKASHALT